MGYPASNVDIELDVPRGCLASNFNIKLDVPTGRPFSTTHDTGSLNSHTTHDTVCQLATQHAYCHCSCRKLPSAFT